MNITENEVDNMFSNFDYYRVQDNLKLIPYIQKV